MKKKISLLIIVLILILSGCDAGNNGTAPQITALYMLPSANGSAVTQFNLNDHYYYAFDFNDPDLDASKIKTRFEPVTSSVTWNFVEDSDWGDLPVQDTAAKSLISTVGRSLTDQLFETGVYNFIIILRDNNGNEGRSEPYQFTIN